MAFIIKPITHALSAVIFICIKINGTTVATHAVQVVEIAQAHITHRVQTAGQICFSCQIKRVAIAYHSVRLLYM